jgi:hypothetical protein
MHKIIYIYIYIYIYKNPLRRERVSALISHLKLSRGFQWNLVCAVHIKNIRNCLNQFNVTTDLRETQLCAKIPPPPQTGSPHRTNTYVVYLLPWPDQLRKAASSLLSSRPRALCPCVKRQERGVTTVPLHITVWSCSIETTCRASTRIGSHSHLHRCLPGQYNV